MTPKKLFIAHYSGDADEVNELATELRLHGIIPWVDKDGGFLIGDELESEARRAIREDCFGLLLYATEHVFDRPFIRNVEIDEARRRLENGTPFMIFAVPRGIGFGRLEERSKDSYGINLSAFHSIVVPEGHDLGAVCRHVASEVLGRVLSHAAKAGGHDVSLQYSTRMVFPGGVDDLLCIDATRTFKAGVEDPANWNRLLYALLDIKRWLTKSFGCPRLRVHGSKHLTAAFMFGRVFTRFEIGIRQTPMEVWSTDAPPTPARPFVALVRETGANNGRLFLEVASGHKKISEGVDAFLLAGGPRPHVRLQLKPENPRPVDNGICKMMARQAYAELERVCQSHQVKEIHIFAAVPQSFMVSLGRELKGMPATHLYEWDGQKYLHCCRIPGGIL